MRGTRWYYSLPSLLTSGRCIFRVFAFITERDLKWASPGRNWDTDKPGMDRRGLFIYAEVGGYHLSYSMGTSTVRKVKNVRSL